MVVRFIFSSILQIWYVKVWISQSTSECPLDLEILRVEYIKNHKSLSLLLLKFNLRGLDTHGFTKKDNFMTSDLLSFTSSLLKKGSTLKGNDLLPSPF